MAISPQEARKLTADEEAAIMAQEVDVDQMLNADYCGETMVLDIPTGWSKRMIREFVRRYREAGWSVSERSDGQVELTEFDPTLH